VLKEILVPLDGSELAERVLTLTSTLLVQEDTEVTLLRVLAPDEAPERQAAVARLEKWRDTLSRQGGRVRCEVVEGEDAAEEILHYAAENGPSLIVLATHGKTGSPRWLRGSVAERVLRRTEHPILLVNPIGSEVKPCAFRRILVPLDGTENSAKVLPLVQNIARVAGSEVVLLHGLGQGSALGKKGAAPPTRREAELELRNRHGKQLDRIPIRTVTTEGDPAAAILDAVESEKPDVVAMTTHGQGKSSHWAFGSVAEQVIGHCRAPLLIYRTAGFTEGAARHVHA